MPALMPSDGSIHPALSAAGFVGTWDWSVTSGQVVLDHGSAEIVAGDPALAGQVIDLDTALTRLHPDDRGWVGSKIQDMAQTCGTMLAEYRVQAPDGSVRWLLDRGRVTRQPDGTLHGQGIWLDVTDTHETANNCKDDYGNHSLNTIANNCLKARDLVQKGGSQAILRLLDLVLFEIGREIARSFDGTDN